ncbi:MULTISPECIES: transglutaminase-like domain-containing protein [unclassified Streptomyces]|uniref:transglutaminase-like domain-containing protein n=1 Tax=unclassified Streptomyces TaxID=2593676 RepID=UPI0023658181|nr:MULTISPECIES: transglutaminase-like domain-containing protein [unclassified Streptomyces]MDF3142178.1 transglutaminase-like domain-containing protein [Streptomyces sp. T21Q-yed]WDF42210.1 transglutaminase-like domain-containing protein [Streptomyces sp. T12]
MEDFYLKQTPYSDPGDLDVSGLPSDPNQLAHLVRDVIIHQGDGQRLGYAIPEQRLREDAESRYVTEILRILGERRDAPLTEAREPEERFVGTCRDFALLHVSLLRATGTPARVRGGFGTYFVDGFHEDHWITEYRLPDGSWRLVDPQVLHPAYGDLGFDPPDVPRDRFLVAGEAWRACRAGKADPETFGFWSVESLRGMWFVRGSLVLDLACRNGVETLPWDGWQPLAGFGDEPLPADDLALLDAVAAAHTDEDVRRLYTDPRLTPPREILSKSPGFGLRRVTLPQR